jgi:hypothetical protein
MMKKIINILMVIIIFVAVIFTISLFAQGTDTLLYDLKALKDISIDTWLMFIGSILCGLLTMIGVFLTLSYNRGVDKYKRLKEVRPYIVCRPSLRKGYYTAKIENDAVFRPVPLVVKNISDNLVKDLKLVSEDVYFNGINLHEEENLNSPYHLYTVLLDSKEYVEAHQTFAYQTNLIINKYSETSKKSADGFIIKVKLKYRDILDTAEYTHYVEYHLTINYTRDKKKYKLFYSDLTNETVDVKILK